MARSSRWEGGWEGEGVSTLYLLLLTLKLPFILFLPLLCTRKFSAYVNKVSMQQFKDNSHPLAFLSPSPNPFSSLSRSVLPLVNCSPSHCFLSLSLSLRLPFPSTPIILYYTSFTGCYRVAPSCLVGWYSSGCSPGTFFPPADTHI